jgi:hypothetical protein
VKSHHKSVNICQFKILLVTLISHFTVLSQLLSFRSVGHNMTEPGESFVAYLKVLSIYLLESPAGIRSCTAPVQARGITALRFPQNVIQTAYKTSCTGRLMFSFFLSFHFIMTDVVSTQLSFNPPPSDHSLDRCALLSKKETETAPKVSSASGNPLRKSAIHHSLKLPIHQYYKSRCLVVDVH